MYIKPVIPILTLCLYIYCRYASIHEWMKETWMHGRMHVKKGTVQSADFERGIPASSLAIHRRTFWLFVAVDRLSNGLLERGQRLSLGERAHYGYCKSCVILLADCKP